MKKKAGNEADTQPTQLAAPFSLQAWVEANGNLALKLTPEKLALLKEIDAEILKSHQKQALYTGAVDAEALKMSPEQVAQVKHLVLLTMKQTAALFNVTPQYIYKMIGEGEFPAQVKLGRMTRFRLADLELYINAHASQN